MYKCIQGVDVAVSHSSHYTGSGYDGQSSSSSHYQSVHILCFKVTTEQVTLDNPHSLFVTGQYPALLWIYRSYIGGRDEVWECAVCTQRLPELIGLHGSEPAPAYMLI